MDCRALQCCKNCNSTDSGVMASPIFEPIASCKLTALDRNSDGALEKSTQQLIPMPMMRKSYRSGSEEAIDSIKMPQTLRSSRTTSFGHLTVACFPEIREIV